MCVVLRTVCALSLVLTRPWKMSIVPFVLFCVFVARGCLLCVFVVCVFFKERIKVDTSNYPGNQRRPRRKTLPRESAPTEAKRLDLTNGGIVQEGLPNVTVVVMLRVLGWIHNLNRGITIIGRKLLDF